MYRAALALFGILSLAYGWHLGSQYRELETAFLNQEHFLPTRIYSDIIRIASPMTKSAVLTRLKNLQYTYKESETEPTLSFTLREIRYPLYLIPTDHPTLQMEGKTIQLEFESKEENSALTSIKAQDEELTEIYLEPELVASLSRSEETTDENKIREFYEFDEFPASIWKAIIAIEDQHFLDHNGFDPRGLLRAVWINLKTLSFAQGGSTLTQQLVKNLLVRRTKNVFKKINELFLSIILESRFEKKRILSRYLNEVYLGQIGNLEIHGVSEGAKHFFGKKIGDLNLAEIAMLAGLIRGPYYYSPYRHFERARSRQELVLDKMVETGQIAEEEKASALMQPIRLFPPPKAQNKAPYFTDFVKSELLKMMQDRYSETEISRAGFNVYTTLDLNLNQIAQDAVEKGVSRLEERFKINAETHPDLRLEGALASVDVQNGYLRALIGGKDYSKSSFNRILNMNRQIGSTAKPFVYLSAIGKKNSADTPYGAAYPLEDAPWTWVYDNGRQSWEPHNYDKEFRGWIPMREALAHSVNVISAKVGYLIGVDAIADTFVKLGIPNSRIPRVPALTLGVLELSPVELLSIYSVLANRGMQKPLRVIRAITEDNGRTVQRTSDPATRVISEATSDLITDMMKDVFKTGTAKSASALGFHTEAAGKTGTTSDHRDSWFAGFTSETATVVWVGIDKAVEPAQPETSSDQNKATTEEKKNSILLTGAGSSLPIWVDYMKTLNDSSPAAPFVASEHLSDYRIDRFSGNKSTSFCPSSQVVIEKYTSENAPTKETCVGSWKNTGFEEQNKSP